MASRVAPGVLLQSSLTLSNRSEERRFLITVGRILSPMSKLSSLYAGPIIATSAVAALAYALVPSAPRLRRGSVVVITGGSRGLGLALAHRFGRTGMRLVLAARSEDELGVARDGLLRSRDVADKDNILLVNCDLTDEVQAAGLIDAALRTFGRIDCLINNAGIIEVGPVEDQPLNAYHRAMQTNFFAALYTTLAALPHMLGASEGNKSIVNIASIGGKIPVPHLAPYVAAKFALTGFSETLHAEVRQKGVRVTTVCPGLMRTGGEEHAHFTGQADKKKAWFQLAAKTPVISATVEHAARKIYSAVQAGSAELTITPQAWLAARIHGLAPATTQVLASFANKYFLPAPATDAPLASRAPFADASEPFADPSPS